MREAYRPLRHAYTLIESLVVIGIIAILIALLVPAVQMVREAAARAQCMNNLKEIALAMHNCHDTNKRFPAGVGFFPGQDSGAYGTCFFHVLPYVEQGPLYQAAEAPGPVWGAWNPKYDPIYAHAIPLLLCPSNPSINNGQVRDDSGTLWGACAYGANAQVFTQTDAAGYLLNPQASRRILDITDGTSSTILLGEKYARCTNKEWREGGSFWAFWGTGIVKPLHAGFAISWSSASIGPNSRFKVQPQPFEGQCDPTLASTPHSVGMNVAMADGSVGVLRPSLGGDIWWALCTPAGNEVIGDADWR